MKGELQTVGRASPRAGSSVASPHLAELDDIATRMLGEMFRNNCAHAVKLLGIGDTAGAREFLTSALQQLDQIESHRPEPNAKRETRNNPITIES